MKQSPTTYEVLALEYGRMERPSRDFYLHHPDPHEGPRPIAYYLWVIRNETHTIVVDLGFDKHSGRKRGRIMVREPLQALSTIGVTPDDVQTFGVGATFVSSSNVSPDVIYQVVKSVFENFEDFRKLHPAFSELKKEEMIKEGLSAPLHDGAIKYYKEAGLIK